MSATHPFQAILLAAIILAPCGVSAADEQIKKLEARITALEKELRELKAERATPREKPGAPAVVVKPAGNELKLQLGGFIQVQPEGGDVGASQGRFPGGPNEIDDRIRIRRARVNVSGDFAEQFDFKLEGDFMQNDGIGSNRTGFSGTDLWLNWHRFPEAQIKAGQFKAPFGLENLAPDFSLAPIEKSLSTNAISPDRQIGVQLWGWPLATLWPARKELLYYRVGVFNGTGRNTNLNDNSEFLWTARLETTPFSGKLFGQAATLKFGGSGLWSRDEAGTNITPIGTLRVNADGSLSPFTLPGRAERSAWNVDGALSIGPFDLRGEYLHASIRPRDGVPRFAAFAPSGYYVQASWYVWKRVLQLVARWESFDPDQAPDDDLRSVTGGINYYIHGEGLKLMLDYIHTWSDFRRAHPEDGRDEFDEVLARMQLMF